MEGSIFTIFNCEFLCNVCVFLKCWCCNDTFEKKYVSMTRKDILYLICAVTSTQSDNKIYSL